MPIKLKKTNIQYDIDTPEVGWIILGVDEDGNLVKKDENGTYEKIVKDETYGIYLRLETDYLTIGNRETDSIEGLYSLVQGENSKATTYSTTAIGKSAHSLSEYSYSRGTYVKAYGGPTDTKKYAYVSGKGYSATYPLISGGENSFVHSYAVTGTKSYGSLGNYSAILGGVNNYIGLNSNYSSIIGGYGNKINDNVINTTVIGCTNLTATMNNFVYVNNLKVLYNIITDSITSNTSVSTNFLNSYTVSSTNITTSNINSTSGHINSLSVNSLNVNVLSVSGFTQHAYFMADGTLDANYYLNVNGGTLNGQLILNKSLSTIKTISNADISNVIIGKDTFSDVSSLGSGVVRNTIIGSSSARRLTSGNKNIVLGTENINIIGTPPVPAQWITSNSGIFIGNDIRLYNNSTVNEIVIGNDLISKGSNTMTLGDNTTQNVYIGGTSTLNNNFTGNIKTSGYIKVGKFNSPTLPETASASNVGAIRYREDTNQSFCEMVMKTGTSTYEWTIIKTNSW